MATITGGDGDDFLVGGDADDILNGGLGNDTLDGGNGGDILSGELGDDILRGGVGNDRLVGGAGSDILDGGVNTVSGGDIADYSGTGATGINANLVTGVAQDGLGGTDTLIAIENLIGGSGNDTLIGNSGANGLRGLAGNDVLDGGGGDDFASYFSDPAPVTVDLIRGIAQDGFGGSDSLIRIESINGSAFSDTIRGDAGRNILQGFAGNDILDGREGTDTVSYLESPTTAVQVNLLTGVAFDGMGGVDTLVSIEDIQGTIFADTLTGNFGRNVIYGFGGSDAIEGGGGIDIAGYQGARANYTLVRAPGVAATLSVKDATLTRDGEDTVTGVERLQFTDGVLAFDNLRTDNAGRGYLIYRAAFDRVPDLEGLGYWIREMDRGQDYVAVVAASFIASPEFVNRYGTNLSNAQFVDQLYQNVLHRAGDAVGVAYWNAELNAGGARSNVLVSFAIGNENYSSVAPLISDGIFFV